MLSSKHLVLAAGLASWALLTMFGKQRHHQNRTDKKLQKIEISTWEGEGGNLPPKVSRVSDKSATPPQN